MRKRQIGLIIAVLALISCLIYLFGSLNPATAAYVISKRIPKLLAILLTCVGISVSTLIFQTLANNRILTPSIIGLDSLFTLLQTAIVFLFGSTVLNALGPNVNYVISLGAMVGFSLLLYKFLFSNERQNIFYLLLVGMVFGTLFQSLSSFMQQVLDPNEFLYVQDKTFASFNSVSDSLLIISIVIMAATLIYVLNDLQNLDVLALGREHAINLGLDYDKVVKRLLKVVALLIAIPTALVGSITFLGLLVVNLAHALMNDHRHAKLMSTSILISTIALVGGQVLIERVFYFSTTISVVINFVGGAYFIYLLLKEERL
ncbi:MAG TPA: iron ABC transporter permease [Firmicutes bacterium]|nr:iron ABC transporter permease [Bacillota bacterium]